MRITVLNSERPRVFEEPKLRPEERPGLRPGDPHREDPTRLHREVWGAHHPKKGLVIMPWWTSQEIVEDWRRIEITSLRGWEKYPPEEWLIVGPYRLEDDAAEPGKEV